MLNKRGFLALLNWVERTDLWSKNERKRREKGEGRASRKGRKCREKERRKWKAGSPSQCPRPLGSVLRGAVGRPGFLPTGSGALPCSASSSASISAFRVPLAVAGALPLAHPTAWKLCLYSLLRPRLLTLFSGLVSPWAAPPPGAFPGPGWLRCPLSSRHTSHHTVW